MKRKIKYVNPEQILGSIYGKSSLEIKMSEKRRDEVIAAAIYTSFINQEFGTRFCLPSNYKISNPREDAEGIDMVILNSNGRKKKLQIKGVHIQKSIERRKQHRTKGTARIVGHKSQRLIKRDSEELTKIMKKELKKIIQDYSGVYLIIHVLADLATQTSLEIAIRNSKRIVSNLMAKEVWFLRNIPVRAIHGKRSKPNCYAYNLIKMAPDKHTYGFSFAL